MKGGKEKWHRGRAVAYWLRHYTTNREVAGSIPDEVIFLNVPNAFGRTRPWGLLNLQQK
jgi:hypothetical protein